ncbi:MAG: aminoglycoside phosphotransferase family protein [Anaerolineae bacterium]|nr:aminoglycoside phosphotransferase family protein [Anaerolineae bacterium]
MIVAENFFKEIDEVNKVLLGLELDILSFDRARVGRSNRNYILTLQGGDKLILRIMANRSFWNAEQYALETLKGVLPVPHILKAGELNSNCYWLLLTHLAGSNLRDVIAFCPESLFFEAGQMLSMIHSRLFPNYGKWDTESFIEFDSPWTSFLRSLLDREVAFLSEHNLLSAKLFDKIYEVFEELKDLACFVREPRLIHRDFKPENILVTRINEKWQITGILDFEHAQIGEAVWDFARVFDRFFLPAPRSESYFLAGYTSIRPLPSLDEARVICQLVDSLGCIRWGYENADWSFVAEHEVILNQLINKYIKLSC